MMTKRNKLLAIALALATFGAFGCVGEDDIDRTQPNRLPKAMFQGAWYVRSTVIGVPGTSAVGFIGSTGTMEKIRWEIQKECLPFDSSS